MKSIKKTSRSQLHSYFFKEPFYKKQGLKSANLTSKWGIFYISM